MNTPPPISQTYRRVPCRYSRYRQTQNIPAVRRPPGHIRSIGNSRSFRLSPETASRMTKSCAGVGQDKAQRRCKTVGNRDARPFPPLAKGMVSVKTGTRSLQFHGQALQAARKVGEGRAGLGLRHISAGLESL